MKCKIIIMKYSNLNDPRFLSQNELLDFIQENAQKIDLSLASIESNSFKSLPPEVQHSIILDLKLQSRQPSKERLDSIMSNSKDALEFSKNQIQYLVKRNYLTEKSMEAAKTNRYVKDHFLNE
jgi:DNA excision repair protein ERCC-5